MLDEHTFLGQFFVRLENAYGPQHDGKGNAYWLALGEYPLEDLQAAGNACVRVCKFFPSIAEIVERLPGHGSADDAALLAWERVMRVVRGGDRGPTPSSLDPAAYEAANSVGWPVLREMGSRNYTYVQSQFVQVYKLHRELERRGQLSATQRESRAQLASAKERKALPVHEDPDRAFTDVEMRANAPLFSELLAVLDLPAREPTDLTAEEMLEQKRALAARFGTGKTAVEVSR